VPWGGNAKTLVLV